MAPMKNIILFDDETRENLLPLTFTRPVCELRVGITTISEKWRQALDGQISYITQDYLSAKFPITITDDNYVINGSLLPGEKLVRLISGLKNNEALLMDQELVAARLGRQQFDQLINETFEAEIAGYQIAAEDVASISSPWDIFMNNGDAITQDFAILTAGKESSDLHSSNVLIGPSDQLFVHESAEVLGASINTETGPVYIGQDAKVMEGTLLRGPLAICDRAIVKMGAKIYGPTTIGPNSKAGGEIKRVVIQSYSNKGHEGFLGDSVLGEWCNIGADTNTSNLKNNYSEVKLWNYPKESFVRTGQMFCGLIMGDHSKCGINTMFNTGTVAGVSANIYGAGYPRNFIPSFSWGGKAGLQTYRIDKALETVALVMARRGEELNEQDAEILRTIFENTSGFRPWERA